MRVDDAVSQRKVELRREQVFHLFPHLYSIDFFVVHRFRPKRDREVEPKQRTGNRRKGREGPVFLRDLCALLSEVSVLSFPEGKVPGRCPRPAKSCPKKKKPRAESGRTFLHSPVYQTSNRLVKSKVNYL